jgi:hypothetical protein
MALRFPGMEEAMDNPKSRNDDQRSSVANQKKHRSQMEGPAAYAPLPDEQSSADEARKHREKMQRQERQGHR